ncbi:Endonuclease III [Neochlamydia sp. AcF65]|uniref:endonuclease III n=1 Tax=unclassified Neochlamydia TaxID=2643326 RepID=UPI001408CB5E|nr:MULTISPECIES: endonuclease III [unclassified Neochlamydia]MBS4165161.1 Endonuclease III [Neochlamydia sp. AcF65]NGY96009.1 Endonuclease III [Neochlamydia sp. AcF84]
MDRKEKAAKIFTILNKLYPNPPIPLIHKDPYTLLIAVLLSAQCTDKCVNQVTPKLFAKADTPEKMAQLDIEDIQKIVRPCGLSARKAAAIHRLSAILAEKYQGKVPDTFEELEALPGIGHKSASVVLSQSFGKPAFPVDTHIYRCALRWGLSKGKTIAAVEKDLKLLFPPKTWNKLHLQIIYFAREYCSARHPHADKCPICRMITPT